MTSRLEAKGLVRRFSRLRAVDGITFDLQAGEKLTFDVDYGSGMSDDFDSFLDFLKKNIIDFIPCYIKMFDFIYKQTCFHAVYILLQNHSLNRR